MSTSEQVTTDQIKENKNVINSEEMSPCLHPTITAQSQHQTNTPRHVHLAVHTPIQVPRNYESRPSIPSTAATTSSCSPPCELTAKSSVQDLFPHAQQNGTLARSRSAMAESKSPIPSENHVSQNHPLLSPQPIRSAAGVATGMAIGIAMPPQFSSSSSTEGDSLLPAKVEPVVERSAIEEEMLVVDNNASSDGILDSIIHDVVESVAHDRSTANEFSAAGGNRGISNGSYPANGHPQRNSRTFFRAPGLEAPNSEAVAGAADSNIWICPVCGFSCSSKFHYNSHMNTHSDHQCPMCNYTSRTEGRLRKHIKESHTREQRAAAGIVEPPEVATPSETAPAAPTAATAAESISTTMASIFDIVSRASATMSQSNSTSSSTNDALLKMVDSYQPSNREQGASGSALDHIKALTERNLLSSTQQANEMLNGANSMLMMANGGSNDGSQGSASTPTQATPSKRSGKPKSYKCKNCDHISRSKDEQWMHARIHIPQDKQLTCTQCNFVTEYKHHLEYHYRNHAGSKPFQCTHPMCHYQCVNKSMLNSHMKSHNKHYGFRCMDCTYQTKYCHSLKMHLRKYSHRRAPGLQMDSDSHDEEMPESDDSTNNTILQQQLQDQFGIGTTTSNTTTNTIDDDHRSSNGSLNKPDELAIMSSNKTAHHPTLNSMLLQPMATGGGVGQAQPGPGGDPIAIQQYASQLLLRHEMMRAASNVLQCSHCDFQTASNEEMIRHNIHHMLVAQQQHAERQPQHSGQPGQPTSQQTIMSLYHNLAAHQQQPQTQHLLEHLQQQQQHHQPNLSNVAIEQLLNGGSVDLSVAAQFQQELALRLQQQQHQSLQRQQEEESRRRTVMTALAVAAELRQHQIQQHQLHHPAFVGGQTEPMEQGYGPMQGVAAINSNTMADDSPDLTLPPHPEGDIAEDSASPSESKSTTQTDGGTSSGSPNSEATPSGSRKQRKPSKTSKVDQISVRLQGKCSTPDNGKGGDEVESNGVTGNASSSAPITSNTGQTLDTINNDDPAVADILMHLNSQMQNLQSANTQSAMSTIHAQQGGRSATSMPYTCQHCMLGFADRALYQIHLGYHGYETPFKCNRCGHKSSSSLEFNLHLYQAKHD